MKFWGWKNVVFFEPKIWWKDDIYWVVKSSCFELFGDGKHGLFLSQEVDGKDDIYWLRKSSCFELLGGGKYDLFWVKKLMERWYLLVTEKLLFWTYLSFQPKGWWKDDIYLVVLSFPWYCRAWEIRFFVQCCCLGQWHKSKFPQKSLISKKVQGVMVPQWLSFFLGRCFIVVDP